MIKPYRVLALALVITASAAVVAVVATAGSGRTEKAAAPIAVSVRYDDLDFNHISDAQVLLDRIKDASVKVCGGAPDFQDRRRVLVFDQCRKAVVIQAVRRFDQPVLTAITDPQTLSIRLAVR